MGFQHPVPLLVILYFVSRIRMLVHSLYKFDGSQNAGSKPNSCYVCEGVLVRDYHLNLLDWVKQFALPEWMGILQPVQGLYRTRKRRKVEFCLSD
jgi:hypothetical protein